MKKIAAFCLTLLIVSSCSQSKKDKLIGTWFSSSIRNKDTIETFVEFNNNKDVYSLYKFKNLGWTFCKSENMDSIKYDLINFISENKYEVLWPDSTKKILAMKSNPTYSRAKKEIKPNKIVFDLLNKFYESGSSLSIDTLGDGTLFYEYHLTETKDKTISALENQVKFFFDKQMKILPKKEALDKFDSFEKILMNSYTWEDLNSKMVVECRFKFKDTKDKYTFNDSDRLEVKIWQNIK